jgi:hypothetical protein
MNIQPTYQVMQPVRTFGAKARVRFGLGLGFLCGAGVLVSMAHGLFSSPSLCRRPTVKCQLIETNMRHGQNGRRDSFDGILKTFSTPGRGRPKRQKNCLENAFDALPKRVREETVGVMDPACNPTEGCFF